MQLTHSTYRAWHTAGQAAAVATAVSNWLTTGTVCSILRLCPDPLCDRAQTTCAARSVKQGATDADISGLYDQVKHLGLTHNFVVRLAQKRNIMGSQLFTAQELEDRVTTLWELTQSDTAEQREALAKKLHHTPDMLNLLPETFRSKAVALQQVFQEQGITEQQVQQLIAANPAVLSFRTEMVAAKLPAMSQSLQLEPQDVVRLWIKQRTVMNLNVSAVNNKLTQLQEMLQLSKQQVVVLVVKMRTLLASSTHTLQGRVAALQECFPHCSQQQLGQALLRHKILLTQSEDTTGRKWRAIQAFAAVDPASPQWLQHRLAVPEHCLHLVSRPLSRYELLEYWVARRRQQQQAEQRQQHEQQPPQHRHSTSTQAAASSPAAEAAADSSIDDAVLHCSRLRDSSSSNSMRGGVSAYDRPVVSHAGQVPLLAKVLHAGHALFQELIAGQQPGLSHWQREMKSAQGQQGV